MTEFVFSQRDSKTQCASLILRNDNSNEGPEEFTLQLSASTPLNVILDPSIATVTISDNVESILLDTFNLTESGDQTEKNLETVGFTLVHITNSASNEEIALDTEVRLR